jgi:muramoyltetrapeptide carboxypeptidase
MLRRGDRVRLISPGGFVTRDELDHVAAGLHEFTVEVGDHALDRHAFLAGTDADRLADLNDALRAPDVRAIVATRGDQGVYRILDGIDWAAAARDPKPIVGNEELTHVHLLGWGACRLVGVHSPPTAGESLTRALTTDEPITLHRDPANLTAAIEIPGQADGILLGGSLIGIQRLVGAGLPDLDGAILLIENKRSIGLGQVDRAFTQLIRSGVLAGVRGIVLGQFPGFEQKIDRGWTVLDVLRDRLGTIGVPVLGGINVGAGPGAEAVRLGTRASFDTRSGTLVVA